MDLEQRRKLAIPLLLHYLHQMTELISKETARTSPATNSVKRRGEKQERSLQRRGDIAAAATEILALHGISGLTHRLVARNAGVSLAATTYYFDTRLEMVAEASRRTLLGHSAAFRRTVTRLKSGPKHPRLFRKLVIRLIHNEANRDKNGALCWAEITLNARYHEESLELTRQWFAELMELWLEASDTSGVARPDEQSGSAIDLVIGLLLVTISLGLTAEQLDAVLLRGADPLDAWADVQELAPMTGPPPRATRKAAETREKIILAAIEILQAEGLGSITYRSIGARAGMTAARLFYHFPTIDGLLAAAQQRLFEDSKERYRMAATEMGGIIDVEGLIDRSAVVLIREGTQFADKNMANYSVWLQAARNPELRPMIWSGIADQYLAWQRLLAPLKPHQQPLDALLVFAIFIGKQFRTLSTGSTLEDLAMVRSEFSRDFVALFNSKYWF